MQSDGNCFYWYVVLDSFNMAYKEEYSFLDQIWKKQLSWYLYYIWRFWTLELTEENAYVKKYSP